MLPKLGAGGAEKPFRKIVPAGQVEFFGEDTEGAVGGDEIDVAYAFVCSEGAEHLRSIDASACSGYGQGNVRGGVHTSDYRLPRYRLCAFTGGGKSGFVR